MLTFEVHHAQALNEFRKSDTVYVTLPDYLKCSIILGLNIPNLEHY